MILEKVRGSNAYRFSYAAENGKFVQWEVNGDDINIDVLQDIIDTVRPPIQPTVPAVPLAAPWSYQGGLAIDPAAGHINTGAEEADRKAREEEQRLMNMGSAISKGIGLGPEDIPVFDNGELPDVNWSQ